LRYGSFAALSYSHHPKCARNLAAALVGGMTPDAAVMKTESPVVDACQSERGRDERRRRFAVRPEGLRIHEELGVELAGPQLLRTVRTVAWSVPRSEATALRSGASATMAPT